MNTKPQNSQLPFHVAEAMMVNHRMARPTFPRAQWVSRNVGGRDVPAENIWIPQNREAALANGGFIDVEPYYTLLTAAGTIMMGWQPSREDMEATDWFVDESNYGMPMLNNHGDVLKLNDVLNLVRIRTITVREYGPVFSATIVSGHLWINYPCLEGSVTRPTDVSVFNRNSQAPASVDTINRLLSNFFSPDSILNKLVIPFVDNFNSVSLAIGRKPEAIAGADTKVLKLTLPDVATYRELMSGGVPAEISSEPPNPLSELPVKVKVTDYADVKVLYVTADGTAPKVEQCGGSLRVNLNRHPPLTPSGKSRLCMCTLETFDKGVTELTTDEGCLIIGLDLTPGFTVRIHDAPVPRPTTYLHGDNVLHIIANFKQPSTQSVSFTEDGLACAMTGLLTGKLDDLHLTGLMSLSLKNPLTQQPLACVGPFAHLKPMAIVNPTGTEVDIPTGQQMSGVSKIILTNAGDVPSVSYDTHSATLRINIPYMRYVNPSDVEPEVYKFKDKARRVKEIVAALDRFVDGHLLYMAIHLPKPTSVDLQTSNEVLFNVTPMGLELGLPPSIDLTLDTGSMVMRVTLDNDVK